MDRSTAEPQMPATNEAPLLRMEAIDKRFPGVHALEQVDFTLRAGEVHVLLGENGAGKSTLMKILCGVLPRDSGRIFVDGAEVTHLTPDSAHALGIGMVHQELSLVPGLSVAENIFLGKMPRTRWGLVDWRTAQRQAEKALADLGVHLDPQIEVRRLEVAEQQLTEIARVLTTTPKILLLDEPTSALSTGERDRLFDIVRRLRQRGVGIVYISHRLNEVPMIGDRVSVMRDGKMVGTFDVGEVTEDDLIHMMVGRRLAEQYPKESVEPGTTLLRVEGLRSGALLHDISFELRQGEILGIFGLMGAGQPELARALFGLERLGAGAIAIDGRPVSIRTPADAIRHGIGLLTRDRRQSLVPMLPIPPNVTLARLSQARQHQRLDRAGERAIAATYVRDLDVQPPILDRPVIYLSGGNQQKVLIARWLASDSRIMIFDEPTRGIDVGAKAEVFSLMNDLTRRGVGVIMISSEMQEILSMADRVLVMRGGTFTAEYSREEATQTNLLRSASYVTGE